MGIIQNDWENMEYVKIYGANILSLFAISAIDMSTTEIIDAVLKIFIALVSSAYTIVKIISIIKNELNRKK